MTISDLAYSIALRLDRDDDKDFVRDLVSSIYRVKADIVKQDHAKYQYVDGLYDTIFMPLQLVEDCGNCRILRSEFPVPRAVRFLFSPPFTTIMTPDNKSKLEYIVEEQVELIKIDRIKSKLKWYYEVGEYIQIINTKLLDRIRIKAVFEDYDEVSKLECLTCRPESMWLPGDLGTQIFDRINLEYSKSLQPDVHRHKLE
jgi:hypothetical protein